MKNNHIYHQFDIISVDLEPTKGSEQQGTRPCLVVESNAIVQKSKTVMVAPFTSKKTNKIYPYEILIKPDKGNGLKETSKLKLNQIKVIDKMRIKNHIGAINKDSKTKILQSIALTFDLYQYFS